MCENNTVRLSNIFFQLFIRISFYYNDTFVSFQSRVIVQFSTVFSIETFNKMHPSIARHFYLGRCRLGSKISNRNAPPIESCPRIRLRHEWFLNRIKRYWGKRSITRLVLLVGASTSARPFVIISTMVPLAQVSYYVISFRPFAFCLPTSPSPSLSSPGLGRGVQAHVYLLLSMMNLSAKKRSKIVAKGGINLTYARILSCEQSIFTYV